MKRSTTDFIAYDLRPTKQAERRVLLDFLKCGSSAGLAIADYRYVGMGGRTFYDFHLMHRFAGIRTMVSLERNPEAYRRCAFNCPFDFIKVECNSAAEFLVKDEDPRGTIYWFDYDDAISAEILGDITTLGTRLGSGSLAFATVCAKPSAALGKKKPSERLEHFKEVMGEFSRGLEVRDFENAAYAATITRLLVTAFINAFSARRDGAFDPLFQVRYSDSSPMVTVGGPFCDDMFRREIRARVKCELPFLLANPPYVIRTLNLTERERAVFDLAVTKRRSNSKEANSLRSMGFRDEELAAYRDLIRFWPRYHEAIF